MEKSLVERIVDELIEDMSGRSGFDDLWGHMDQPTKNELRQEWIEIVEGYVK